MGTFTPYASVIEGQVGVAPNFLDTSAQANSAASRKLRYKYGVAFFTPGIPTIIFKDRKWQRSNVSCRLIVADAARGFPSKDVYVRRPWRTSTAESSSFPPSLAPLRTSTPFPGNPLRLMSATWRAGFMYPFLQCAFIFPPTGQSFRNISISPRYAFRSEGYACLAVRLSRYLLSVDV